MLRTQLLIDHEFRASHSLDTRETPHFHLWKLTFAFGGKLVSGRLIDFPVLSTMLRDVLTPIEGSHLNDSDFFTSQVHLFPTCETLGEDLFHIVNEKVVPRLMSLNPTLELASVQVTLYEGNIVFGSAIVERRSS